MTTDINMSLDDIIKKNKSSKSFNARKKPGQRSSNQQPGRRNNPRAGGGGGKVSGGPRFRSNSASGNRSRSAARFTPYKRGDIESEWSHDLYDDGYIAKRTEYDAVGTKVLVSNLDFGVTESDLEELFLDIGPLISCEIHYDKSGRSNGEGSVLFEDRTDAIRAIKQYSGVPLDGRPMKIAIASAAPPRLIESRRLGNFRNRNAGGNGGGGGGNGGGGRRRFNNRNGNAGNRNRRSNNKLSAEQLDAELDEMRAKNS